MPASSTSLVSRAGEQITVSIDETTAVVLQTSSGVYYELDRVSARIWGMLASPTSVNALSRVLAAEYGVDLTQCRADIALFVEQLRSAGLVSTVDGDGR